MSASNRDQLRIVLLALLPKDGQCMAACDLAAMAQVSIEVVDDVLSDEWMLGRVGYGCTVDGGQGYSAIRQGDNLPGSATP